MSLRLHGPIIRKALIGEDGMHRERARLEAAGADVLERAFRRLLRLVAPPGTTTDNISADIAAQRLRNNQNVLRDAVVEFLTRAALAGAGVGLRQVEQILGVGKQANIGLANWDLVNQAVLTWLMGPADGFGTGYADEITASIVSTSETHIRTAIAEWTRNGLPLSALVDTLEGWVFSRDRAETIAATEVTRAYARGNIEAWRASGVVTGMAWRTANDERVCPICAPLGGLEFSPDGAEPASRDEQRRDSQRTTLDGEFTHPGGPGAAERFRGQAFQHPPAHPRCRCWIVPLTS